MFPWEGEMAGRLDELRIDSALLAGNPLGDPASRPLWVQLPPGYDDDDRRHPAVYVIQGYTGHLAIGATGRRSGSRSWRPRTQ